AVQRALADAGEVQDRLAHRLGRDRAGVDADAADVVVALDEGDAAAELGGAEGGLLAGGAGADNHEVVGRWGHGSATRRSMSSSEPGCPQPGIAYRSRAVPSPVFQPQASAR